MTKSLLKDVVDSILDERFLKAKQELHLLLSEKVEKALKEKKKEIAEEYFNTEPCCDDCVNEARPIVYWRVNSKGQKVKKFICPKGHKRKGNTCVPQGSAEKQRRKMSALKAKRTKRANQSVAKRAVKKRRIAARKRKVFGLRSGSRLSG